MKKILFTLITLTLNSTLAQAEREWNCEESAVDYIVAIANAPYREQGPRLTEEDLALVSKKAIGDGAEAYELYVFQNKESDESYKLKLYIEEIGGVCPLERYEVVYN